MTNREPLTIAGEFMRLYLANEASIRGYILCSVSHWADADDLVQQTVAVMWRKYHPFESNEHFLAWAIRIARYEILGYLQSRQNRLPQFSPAVLEALQTQATKAAQEEDLRSEALQSCMGKLGPRDRELLLLRYELDATPQRVSQVVGRSVDAVYKALNRIHYQLLLCIRRTLAQEAHA